MTGIERLRQMAEDFKSVKTAEHCTFIVNTWRGRYIDDAIADIADQIERENTEDTEAAAWVRDHGGLDAVEAHWSGRVPLTSVKRMVALHKKKRDRLKAHALWLERKCHERRERIAALNETVAEMRPRLIPEGMEWLVEAWPRFEDGEPVRIGDKFECWCGEEHVVGSVSFMGSCAVLNMSHAHTFVVGHGPETVHGKRVRRPATKVLDADGAEIREGDTLWHVETGEQCKVVEVDSRSVSVDFRVDGDGTKHTGSILPTNLTHRAPVLAADGRPLREGETVWSVDSGTRYTVEKITDELMPIKCRSEMGTTVSLHPSQLTHERPVADTWERLEEDCAKSDVDYCAERGLLDSSCDVVEGDGSTRHCTDCGCTCGEKMARDLVRRARALAERGR